MELQQKVDRLFQVNLTGQETQRSIKDVLQLNKTNNGHRNAYANGSSVIINSDRLIFNAKKDHLFLCGNEGVTITSPKSVHIDADDDVYIFSNTGEIYLGLPNRGEKYDQLPAPKTKADATLNYAYEPMVLGLKLANLLEDFIVIMRDAVIRTPSGDGRMSVEMMYNLESLQSRIPEMLSTVAFIEGISHDKPDAAPQVPSGTDDPAQLPTPSLLTEIATAGNTTSGTTTTATNTNLNNTVAPVILPQSLLNAIQGNMSNNPDGPITQ